jgi:hypothetical protein
MTTNIHDDDGVKMLLTDTGFYLGDFLEDKDGNWDFWPVPGLTYPAFVLMEIARRSAALNGVKQPTQN